MPADLHPPASSPVRRTLPAMRLTLVAFAVLTALAVVSLYVMSEDTDRLFAWTIQPPLTAAFLGAGYAAGCLLVVLSLREPVWANNRIPVLTILGFTALTLVATLVHLDKFHFDVPGALPTFAAWFWMAIYVVVPLALVALVVQQERAPGADPLPRHPVPGALRALLAVQSVVMTVLGVALFVAPDTQEQLWPWTLTPLTARVVAAWLLAFGLATGLASRGGDLDRLRTATAAYAVFGVLELLALLRFRDTVEWDRAVAWLLTALLLAIALTGAAGWRAAVRARPAGQPARDVPVA